MLYQLKNWFTYHILKRPVGGLIDERDERNFSARVIAGEVTKDDLTNEEFQNCYPVLKHQKSSDFCVGYSKAYGKEATEGRTMSGPGAFAMGCRSQGYSTGYGISIYQVMKGAVKYGVPEDRLWPLTGNRDHDADWTRMPQEVLANAELHKDQSFFQLYHNPDMDIFDQIRAYLYKFRDNKIVIQTGADGHAITIIGQKKHPVTGELCIFGPDSYGAWNYNYRVGKCINGYRYFTRQDAVYNLFTPYFSFDMARDLAELLNTYDGKAVKLESTNDCYLVKSGQKHLLRNEAIAWSHNTLLFGENYVFVLTQSEFDTIPTGSPASFGDGPNHEIIRRVLEKTGRADLIDGE